ncbi:MAG: pyridoxal phosphate-dependent aminotransferase [Gammaproteobacteria bacterium]|nr:MAG: pyridoxal phosphate-dependent aminotransferase [Gammaproteobacteria bacterium]
MKASAQVSQRAKDIAPFHVMDILARARLLESQGHDVIHMEIGEPDFVTPGPIVSAGIKALKAGHTHYTPAMGLPLLREKIASHYRDAYQTEVSPDQVVITPGSSGALQLVLAVAVNPGQKVLMADPGYPCNRHILRLLDGQAVMIPVGAETQYQLTPELIRRYWDDKTIAVLVASPSNPTGTMLDIEAMRSVVDTVRGCGGRLIVDEIYHGLVYEAATNTVLKVSPDVFVVNSFSKYYGMTGWRLGWLVAPASYVSAIDRIAQNLFLAASTPAQYAALAAFDVDTRAILLERRDVFRKRRDYLLPALRDLGFDVPVQPPGAFYIYANSSALSNDSFQLCMRLLDEAHVAITPGIDFGHNHAGQHVRFAYTTSIDKLKIGIDRLHKFLSR